MPFNCLHIAFLYKHYSLFKNYHGKIIIIENSLQTHYSSKASLILKSLNAPV